MPNRAKDWRRFGYFGSYARGDYGPGSDVDLIAIVRRAQRPFHERALELDVLGLPVPAQCPASCCSTLGGSPSASMAADIIRLVLRAVLTTVKLPKDLHTALENAARLHGLSKSEVLRKALRSELARLSGLQRPTPWELGKQLFGRARSGRSDLSTVRARHLLAARRRRKAVRG